MRGDEPIADNVTENCALEFPACAGMNRSLNWELDVLSGSSPHARG